MKVLAIVLAMAGSWHGTSTLYLPDVAPDSNLSAINVSAVLDNRFVRLDYTWKYQDTLQEGSLVIGYDGAKKEAVASWIDTWHMGNQIMALKGTIDSTGTITLNGTYAAPPGPDWGWKIVISHADTTMHLVMYNILPDGQEFLAVEGRYERK